MDRLVVATHNRKKAGEMIQILRSAFPNLELMTLEDFPGIPEPEETGATYGENAEIKAEAAASRIDEWCLADDAGLEIDALQGAPGLRSKRFEGVDSTFEHKIGKILELLDGVREGARTARFRCCLALSKKGVQTKIWVATCEGRIAHEPSGDGGFGYDPIFFLPELGCTMADLSAEEKHSVSHRGKVLRMFVNDFEKLGIS